MYTNVQEGAHSKSQQRAVQTLHQNQARLGEMSIMHVLLQDSQPWV
jgi:hypothetical protein